MLSKATLAAWMGSSRCQRQIKRKGGRWRWRANREGAHRGGEEEEERRQRLSLSQNKKERERSQFHACVWRRGRSDGKRGGREGYSEHHLTRERLISDSRCWRRDWLRHTAGAIHRGAPRCWGEETEQVRLPALQTGKLWVEMMGHTAIVRRNC